MKTFEVLYQAAKHRNGLVVQMDVYKADKTKDEAQSVTMTEIGSTGRYYASFTADAPNWHVAISDNRGGSAIKHFGPELYDVVGIQAAVAAVQTDVAVVAAGVAAVDAHLTAVEAKVEELSSPPMIG